LYQWYADGFGALTDGIFQGATITGSGTTTLTITNVTSPIANGLRLFVDVDYIPSAYSQPVGSAVTVGTGRSTGNAVNEVLNSNSATLTVFPVLSVAQQPTDQTAAITRSAIFTTLGALTDTTQGNISYRWQLNGNDLSDSTTIIGSGTTSLSVSLPNIITSVVPIISGSTRFYLINFSVPVDTASIPTFERIGAGGNSQPTLRITEFVRISSQQYRLRFAVDIDNFCRNFTIQATPSSSQPILQNNTVTHITVSGTTTISIDWSPGTTTNTVRARLTHPTACNSPIFTNTVNFSVVSARQIINFEGYLGNGTIIAPGFGSVNLFNGPYTNIADALSPSRTLSIYASERDLSVRITMAGAAGQSRNAFRGGEGGISVFELIMKQNIEYIIRLGSLTQPSGGANGGAGGSFLYERSRVIAICGGGGAAGTSGAGGNGGGISVVGSNGSGRNSGNGAAFISPGALPASGFFAGGLSTGNPYNGRTTGGRVSGCPWGNFWPNTGLSPCQNFSGLVQARTATTGFVSGTASINRGFKPGNLGYRVNGGNGSGNDGGAGSGAVGGNAATGGFGGGGGGGSGYHDGSINLISSQSGGNTSTNGYIIIQSLI
jgi:hypothetical protein